MTKTKLSLIAALALVAASAQAEGTYLEMGYGGMKYTEPSLSMTPSVARAIVGLDLNDNLSVEGMAAAGLSNGSTTYSGVGVSLKMDNAYGFYVKPKLKINDSVEVFGRAGFTHLTGNATLTGNRGSLVLNADGEDTSFGIGAKVSLSKTSYVVMDYMSYYSKEGISIKGYTLGFGLSY